LQQAVKCKLTAVRNNIKAEAARYELPPLCRSLVYYHIEHLGAKSEQVHLAASLFRATSKTDCVQRLLAKESFYNEPRINRLPSCQPWQKTRPQVGLKNSTASEKNVDEEVNSIQVFGIK